MGTVKRWMYLYRIHSWVNHQSGQICLFAIRSFWLWTALCISFWWRWSSRNAGFTINLSEARRGYIAAPSHHYASDTQSRWISLIDVFPFMWKIASIEKYVKARNIFSIGRLYSYEAYRTIQHLLFCSWNLYTSNARLNWFISNIHSHMTKHFDIFHQRKRIKMMTGECSECRFTNKFAQFFTWKITIERCRMWSN